MVTTDEGGKENFCLRVDLGVSDAAGEGNLCTALILQLTQSPSALCKVLLSRCEANLLPSTADKTFSGTMILNGGWKQVHPLINSLETFKRPEKTFKHFRLNPKTLRPKFNQI